MPVYEIKSSFKGRNYETVVMADNGAEAIETFNKDYSFREIKRMSECRGNRIVFDKPLPTEEEIGKLEGLLKKSGF